jgi:hypothetical protein
MTATAHKLATYEDLFDLPENLVAKSFTANRLPIPAPRPSIS